MLTSPVNVVIPASNGVALKANTATSDHSARRDPPLPPHHQAQAAEAVTEPELPANSPLASVNAVTATVANRTVLQELTLNVATMLRIARRTDENLTSLFLRIIATIETMPQAERLQFEIRAGLKPLKITLADLVMALRKPDGPEAARLTATAEAPTATPGRTAANAATTTYLEEGTDSGHTEETLAMRAAARNSAAGQSLFSAESKVRPADAQPADAKVLQNQLKVMFEPGETKSADKAAASAPQQAAAEDSPVVAADAPLTESQAGTAESGVKPAKPEATPPNNLRQPMPPAGSTGSGGETVTFSSANLKLDPLTVEKIRNVAQAIANLAETVRADQDRPASDKVEDRRLQTMLTLKGLAEVVTAIPAKAAELLAAVVAEAAGPLPDTADERDRVDAEPSQPTLSEGQRAEFALNADDVSAKEAAAPAPAEGGPAEAPADGGSQAAEHADAEADAVMVEEHQAAPEFEDMQMVRQDLARHGVPFTYAQLQPARDEMSATVEEEAARDETDEEAEDEGGEDGERHRPRDEYDAIHDPVEEDEPAVVITRDSSESDRAFALYQRMGGF